VSWWKVGTKILRIFEVVGRKCLRGCRLRCAEEISAVECKQVGRNINQGIPLEKVRYVNVTRQSRPYHSANVAARDDSTWEGRRSEKGEVR